MTLAVGHITYANCAPFFHHLEAVGFAGRIVHGVPARLNGLLASGEIDISPSSSFEYGRRWRDYLLLPDFSISSRGPVQSVLLFSPGEPGSLAGQPIALTGESATSVHLLHLLLREFYGLPEVVAAVPTEPVEELLAAGRPALLIGDRALRASLAPPPGMRIYDLGELWYHHTRLPFVFALWILRRPAAAGKRDDLLALQAQLAEYHRRAFTSLATLAAASPERSWFGEERLIAYWQAMSFGLDADHLAGLQLFFDLCVKYGFLEEMPEIQFFS
ncbi:MAG: menaquinone biosynthesis protein [Desulfuromonadales bacterium]|nr:menaquinone biosynthesis protein [Desulfuromonadales bacterium]